MLGAIPERCPDASHIPSTILEREDDKYIKVEGVLSRLETWGGVLRLENRKRQYMWGLVNSGELPTLPRNKADGDKWDAFCPGYPVLDTKKTYDITNIRGVMFVDNQNHKIAVGIDERGYDDDIAQKEIALLFCHLREERASEQVRAVSRVHESKCQSIRRHQFVPRVRRRVR